MGQRNLLCTSEMLDLEMDQPGQHHPHPEPCVFLGRISDFPHPNIHPVLSASGNSSNFGLQHLPDHHDSRIFYGTQYNGLQHDHPMENHNFSGVAASNFYNPYMTPSGSRIFPIPLNHGSFDQLPSSSNHMITGVGLGEYGRNNHFMDGVSGLCKRKNAEGFPGNYQHAEGSTSSSSSSSAPLNMELHHWEEQFESEAGVLDIAAFAPPENRVNSVLSITEGGPRRTVRIRPGPFGLQLDSVRAHNHQHLIQGNYMGQSFQPASSALGEQHFRNNGGDGGTSTWNYAPALPYLNGRSVSGGSLEIMNMTGLRHQETRSNGNSTLLLYPSVSQHQSQQHHHRHHHHLPPHMQGVQSHDYNYHPPVTTTSSWHPTSNTLHRSSLNPSQVDVGTVPRYQRHILPNGFRIHRPHQRAVPLEAPEYGNIPRLRILSEDGVAILDFADIGNFIDHHSDMRMDIDHMSYEELLALEERIGNVNTGLIEENIVRHLKTRTHVPLATYFNFNKPLGMDQEAETCIICQDEYKSLEKIGTLDCGHEYHADCIKKWLLVKNVCPICKTSALAVESKD